MNYHYGGEDRLLTAAEVAQILGIARKTVYNRVSAANFCIPHQRILGRPRWKLSSVMAFIANGGDAASRVGQ